MPINFNNVGGNVGATIGKYGLGLLGTAFGGPIGGMLGAGLGNLAGRGLGSLFETGAGALGSGIGQGLSGVSMLVGNMGQPQGTGYISPSGIAFGNVPSAPAATGYTSPGGIAYGNVPAATQGAGPSLGHYITQMGQGVTGYGAQAMSEARNRNII